MKLTERLLASTDIQDVVTKIGNLKLNKVGEIRSGDCPTGHPSVGGLSFCVIPEKNIFFCFNCGVEGNAIDLIKLVQNKSDREAVE